jgi:ribosome biogenesis protein Tsr3
MRKKAPPALLLQDADDVCCASSRRASLASKPTTSESDPAAAITLDPAAAGMVSNHDKDDGEEYGLCFTPHAPAEGGKVNAIMMRKLGKGKSLRRLEEVMLMVAAHPGDVESGGLTGW